MSDKKRKRLLYFSPTSSGGLADYAREQANALADLAVQVEFLTSGEFRKRAGDRFVLLPCLREGSKAGGPRSRMASRLTTARRILRNVGTLTKILAESGCQHVLLGAYGEYLAPLWAHRLRRFSRQGYAFGAVVHDPIRDFAVGPLWWHRWSVACGYSFLREAFVHERVQLDVAESMPRLRTTVIPHGNFQFPAPTKPRLAVRSELGLPAEALVLLAFGHIRDGKNLDLVLQMLKEFPDAHLVVAGKEQSTGQKPAAYYQKLGNELGVGDRCHWLVRFIPEEEIGNLFEAADLALLTYGGHFRSASGVLNASVRYRKPCLASSGPGNLQSVVKDYGLGVWVEPDDLSAMVQGLRRWQEQFPSPRWADYERENSWQRNAELVADRIFENR